MPKKGKDPAVLFYTSDFLTGVTDLTMEERGQYITLLCLQHQKGRLSEKMIKVQIGEVSTDVLSKFFRDKNGLFYHKKMEAEIERRQKYSQDQSNKAKKRWNNGNATGYATAYPRDMHGETATETVTESVIRESNNFSDKDKKDFDFIERNYREIQSMKDPFTIGEVKRLMEQFDQEMIHEVLEAMENHAGLKKKYKSANLTARNWIKKRVKDSEKQNDKIGRNTKADIREAMRTDNF